MGQNESNPETKVKPEEPVRRCRTPLPNCTKTPPFPTRRQCCLLQKSWHRAQQSGPLNIGARVMLQVFRNDSSAMSTICGFEAPIEEIEYHKSFQYFAAIITRALATIISKIDDPKAISIYCRELGRRHVRHVKKGFQTRWWDTFAESLTECAIEWEGGQRCKEALNGWRILVIFIIDEMRSGFQEEKKRVASLQSSGCLKTPLVDSLPDGYCSPIFRSRTSTE